jgi:hypothetical protein
MSRHLPGSSLRVRRSGLRGPCHVDLLRNSRNLNLVAVFGVMNIPLTRSRPNLRFPRACPALSGIEVQQSSVQPRRSEWFILLPCQKRFQKARSAKSGREWSYPSLSQVLVASCHVMSLAVRSTNVTLTANKTRSSDASIPLPRRGSEISIVSSVQSGE